ncbi:hypothetical protein CVS30_09105 [Arthrobacter psychrolactophilus]|uniref:Uncharacterized protein n=1 Tax=Arthrobacter psychrolactophilus TaxID=92442 RepID=A0A2V5IRQ6_9MICC|nr:hypothetical protein CVS30_09105 [Arthrobacter psychrolactophilus]
MERTALTDYKSVLELVDGHLLGLVEQWCPGGGGNEHLCQPFIVKTWREFFGSRAKAGFIALPSGAKERCFTCCNEFKGFVPELRRVP